MKTQPMLFVGCLAVIFFAVAHVSAQTSCSLATEQAYKSSVSNAVWYVSDDCAKRPIKNPDVFFSHFSAWSDVRVVEDGELAAIPNHELGFLPWGTRREYKNGSLVKTVDDPNVYVLLDGERFPIESEDAFRGLGYDFSQVEDVFPAVLNTRPQGRSIAAVSDYPGSLVFSIGGTSDLYLLERDANGSFAKRRIESFDDVSRDYRTDRIADLPAGTVVYDSLRPAFTPGSSLRNAGNVALVEAAPTIVQRTAVDPALQEDPPDTRQPIVSAPTTDTTTSDTDTTQPVTPAPVTPVPTDTNTDTSVEDTTDTTDSTDAETTNPVATPTPTPEPEPSTTDSVFTASHPLHNNLHFHGRTNPNDPDGGSFRIKCEFSHMNYDDPIVYPDQLDRSHLHMFFGNTTARYDSTLSSFLVASQSTCHGGPLNKSAYWVPTVLAPQYDSSGTMLRDANSQRQATPVLPRTGPEATDVYYKAGVDDLASIQPMPDGLRMISGNAMTTGPQDLRYFQWQCASTQIRSFEDYSNHIPACGIGDHVIMVIAFPNCWDGINLDSADHASHMAYAGAYNWPTPGLVCPTSHPVPVPSVSYIIQYAVTAANAGPDGTSRDWFLSSDMYDIDADPGGYSVHGDWFMAWDTEIMQTLTQNCLRGGLHCSDGELGNGWSLNGGAAVGPGTVPTVVNGGMIGPSRSLSETGM